MYGTFVTRRRWLWTAKFFLEAVERTVASEIGIRGFRICSIKQDPEI
jgi:hypothetical protein